MPEFADLIPLSLYVHVPWCVRKCPYCDFNSHGLKSDLPENAYIDALLADLEAESATLQSRTVESVFIGGGTPSLLSPDAVVRLIEGIGDRVKLTPGCEITLEANPGTAEADRFAGFRQAGITRLSIGVQSFDDQLLASIGRIHDGRQARAAAEMAKAANFDSLNLDLMYALPGQSLAQALSDIETALELQPTHLSYYQLTLEPNTLFFRHPPVLPAEESAWRMSQQGIEHLQSRGYARYEVSAFARPGFECRHNLNYWRFGDYAGIGAGAHGKLTDLRRKEICRSLKQRHPRVYLEAGRNGRFARKREVVGRDRLPLEFMMNALRLVAGFDLALFSDRSGITLGKISQSLAEAESKGMIEIHDGMLRPTELGIRFLDDLLLLFAPKTHTRRTPSASPCAPSGKGLISLGDP
jgi:putative oxygen-independent coproporphyrinogen III oxidase